MERTAFTLIELLVVIAIISLLVSILLPSLNSAREMAKSAACMAGMKSIGTSMVLYGEEHDGLAPVLNPCYQPQDKDSTWQPLFDTAKEAYYKNWWSGVLIDQGYLSLNGTHCGNPRGYTGGDQSGIVNPTLAEGGAILPVRPAPSVWYDGNGGQGPGYDYVMTDWLARPEYGKWPQVGPDPPNMYNALVPSRAVMIQEWCHRTSSEFQSWTWAGNGSHMKGQHCPGTMVATVGYGGAYAANWTGRFVRHYGGRFGTNNFVFADGHAAAVPARFDYLFWFAGGWDGMEGIDCIPHAVYPEISFNTPGNSPGTYHFFGWVFDNIQN